MRCCRGSPTSAWRRDPRRGDAVGGPTTSRPGATVTSTPSRRCSPPTRCIGRSPYTDPDVGIEAIKAFWLEDDDEVFAHASRARRCRRRHGGVAPGGPLRRPVHQEYRDLWVMRFAEAMGVAGRELEEWPFWPGQPYAAPTEEGDDDCRRWWWSGARSAGSTEARNGPTPSRDRRRRRRRPARWRQAIEGLPTSVTGNADPSTTCGRSREYTDHVRETAFGMRFALDVVRARSPGTDLGDPPTSRFEPEPRRIDVDRALAGFDSGGHAAVRTAPCHSHRTEWDRSWRLIGGEAVDVALDRPAHRARRRAPPRRRRPATSGPRPTRRRLTVLALRPSARVASCERPRSPKRGGSRWGPFGPPRRVSLCPRGVRRAGRARSCRGGGASSEAWRLSKLVGPSLATGSTWSHSSPYRRVQPGSTHFTPSNRGGAPSSSAVRSSAGR